jgi:hypothetical protein
MFSTMEDAMTQVDIAAVNGIRGLLLSAALAIVVFWLPLAVVLTYFVRNS